MKLRLSCHLEVKLLLQGKKFRSLAFLIYLYFFWNLLSTKTVISQLNTKLMYLLFPGHSRDLQQLGSILQSLNLHFDKI